jgi:PKD repeat protein
MKKKIMKKKFGVIAFALTLFILPPELYSQQFFEDVSLTGSGQGSLSWGDYDSDGYLDILLSGWNGSESVADILRNNGNYTFSDAGISLTGIISSSVAWGDCDNDGDMDVLITGSTSGVTLDAIAKIFINNGGSFTEIASGLPGVYHSSVSWGDHDRDGDQDILMTGMITTGERISRIYNNDGTGVFTEHTGTTFIPVHKGYSSFADFDNDGYLDVVICGETATLSRISMLYRNNGDGTYTEQSHVALRGLSYGSGTWGDLNNDGFIDLVLTGEDASFNVLTKIYLNDTNGGLTEQAGNSVEGAKRCALICGDYDNDGDLDLFLSGERDNTAVTEIYDNNGSGVFSKNITESIEGTYESSIGLADYDNDDDLDLLVTGFDNTDTPIARIYKNNNTTANNNPEKPLNLNYEINNNQVSLTWDRVTGDETAAASLTYNIRIGYSPLTNEVISSQSDNSGKRKVVSFGNTQLNNRMDLKTLRWNTDYYASVQAVDNSFSGGPFSDPVTFRIDPQQPTKLTGSNYSKSSILLKWQRGNGDRCILFAKEGASGPSSPVNNTTYFANSYFADGSPLGATDWYCIYKGTADSVILSGLDPAKDYTVHAIEFQGANGSETYATEINPDNDNIGVFSSGIFTVLSGISMTGLGAGSVAWGDYNNDGYLDILSTGQKVGGEATTRIYRNNGDNTFTDQTTIDITGVYFGSCAWGDYNNDDLLDFVITGYNQSFGAVTRIYKNNGDNSFTWQENISLTGITYSSVGWADFDNDGDIDLLISGQNLSIGVVTKLYRNDGNDTFTELTDVQIKGLFKGSVAWGDYDNDGMLDILLSGLDGITSGARNYSGIYRNNGDGTFSEQTGIELTPVSFSSLVWGDYDNDNNLDILLTGSSGYLPNYIPETRIYHNNGDNTFTELTGSSLTGVSLSSAEWGDYNNDGHLDILITGDSGYKLEFKIYLNTGNNGFSELPALNIPGAYYSNTSSADYDSDGDLDILFTGNNGTYSNEIYRNNLYMMAGEIKPNTRPEAPTELKSEVKPGSMVLSWTGIETDETWFVNMSYNVRAKRTDEEKWAVAPHSTAGGYRSLNSLGNTQLNRSFEIIDPESGTYLWQVQAVDQSYSGSEWSEVDTVIIKKTQAFFETDTVCFGLETHFTDQSVVTEGIAAWSWDFDDGTGSSAQNPVHLYSESGTYNVKLLVTSNTGDKDSLFQSVIVKAIPMAEFTAPNVCIGSPTVFTNTSDANGLTVSGWLWEFGDSQTSALEEPGNHTFALKGTYQTRLTAIAANGCADTITKNVIVAGYPSTTLSANNKLTVCEGDTITLSAESDPDYTYQWKMDDNNLTNATEEDLKIATFSATYSVQITNTLANCITISDNKTITINPVPPVPAIVADNYTAGECLGEDPVRLRVDQEAAGNNYIWARNEVPVQNSVSSVLEGFLEPGNYTVSAEQNGCSAKSQVFEISSQGAPDKPLLFARGPNVWYIGSNVTTASQFKWYYNNDLIVGANENYYVADQNLGTYFLRVKNSDGCFARSDALVIPTDDYLPEVKAAANTDPFANLKIYPNPSPGIFTIEMDNDLSGDLIISIINQGGKGFLNIRFKKTTSYFSSQIDLSGQTKGAYLINLRLDKYFKTHQIIIE